MSRDYFYFSKPAVNDSLVNRIKRVTTSGVLLCLGFITTKLFYLGCIYAFSKLLGYKPEFGFTKVIVPPHEPQYWSMPRILVIYVFPALILLALSAMVYRIVTFNNNRINILRLYLLWVLVSCCLIFTTIITTTILGTYNTYTSFYEAFAIVALWWGINPVFIAIFSFTGLLLSIGVGYLFANEYLRFSHSSALLKTRWGKLYSLRIFFLFPFIFFLPVLALVDYPDSVLAHIPFMLSSLLMGVGMMLKYEYDYSIVLCNRNDVCNRLSIDLLAVLLVLVAALHFAV